MAIVRPNRPSRSLNLFRRRCDQAHDADRKPVFLVARSVKMTEDLCQQTSGPAVLCCRDPDNIALEFFEEP